MADLTKEATGDFTVGAKGVINATGIFTDEIEQMDDRPSS
jgi:glycerol-3-phosphate dehydrogenase